MIIFGGPPSPKNLALLKMLPGCRGDRSKFTREEVEFVMSLARQDGAQALESSNVEDVARMIARAGLGTMDGGTRHAPPNETWTPSEWNARMLECIPTKAEAQCRALAEQIVEFIGGQK